MFRLFGQQTYLIPKVIKRFSPGDNSRFKISQLDNLLFLTRKLLFCHYLSGYELFSYYVRFHCDFSMFLTGFILKAADGFFF